MSSSTPTIPPTTPKANMPNIAIFIVVIGVLGVIGSLIAQYNIMDHGSSNQLTIDALHNQTMIGVLTAGAIFSVGLVMWLFFSTWRNKYLPLFLLAFSSYIVANIAVVFSLYQVQLSKV